jgi:hypothetical protein
MNERGWRKYLLVSCCLVLAFSMFMTAGCRVDVDDDDADFELDIDDHASAVGLLAAAPAPQRQVHVSPGVWLT